MRPVFSTAAEINHHLRVSARPPSFNFTALRPGLYAFHLSFSASHTREYDHRLSPERCITMGLLFRLRTRADAVYDEQYHHKLRGRFWRALEGTEFDSLHGEERPIGLSSRTRFGPVICAKVTSGRYSRLQRTVTCSGPSRNSSLRFSRTPIGLSSPIRPLSRASSGTAERRSVLDFDRIPRQPSGICSRNVSGTVITFARLRNIIPRLLLRNRLQRTSSVDQPPLIAW